MPVKVERPLRIMLVDDNIIDLRINSKVIALTALFDEIIQCQSGEEALAYFTSHASEPEKLPNFILLDIQMPEMDGFEFLDNYKQFPEAWKNHCFVAMLSSTLDFGDIHRAEANPDVLKLFKKPLIPSELEGLFKVTFDPGPRL